MRLWCKISNIPNLIKYRFVCNYLQMKKPSLMFAMRQQAIAWGNVDPDVRHYVVSRGHNWLIVLNAKCRGGGGGGVIPLRCCL